MSMKKIKAIVEGEIELDFEIDADEARTLLSEINAAIANHKREWRDAMGSVWEKEDMARKWEIKYRCLSVLAHA